MENAYMQHIEEFRQELQPTLDNISVQIDELADRLEVSNEAQLTSAGKDEEPIVKTKVDEFRKELKSIQMQLDGLETGGGEDTEANRLAIRGRVKDLQSKVQV